MADTTSNKVVTRFAPSPTGHLHIGGARTALFAWAYARQHQGTFILRIEDTDQTRSSDESTRAILEDLQWLGLDWDQGPQADDITKAKGENGPYFQSQRLDHYKAAVAKLREAGLAYDDGEAVRFKRETDIVIDDAVYGHIEVKAADLEDFVIQKSDGFPTFHLAVVVDDAEMGVTHVLRGQEHLSNTPKHVALQEALGYPTPVYVHLPSIMNPNGSKMSKRDKAKAAREAAKQADLTHETIEAVLPMDAGLFGEFMEKKNDDLAVAAGIAKTLGLALPEINVSDFKRSGYLPGVLLNYLALLGWNPKNDVERFDLDFLTERFNFAGIGKSNSKFDRDKLFRFNGDTLQGLAPDMFRSLLKAHLLEFRADAFGALANDEVRFKLFADAYQGRSRTLDEPAQLGQFFVVADDAYEYDDKARKKVMDKNDGEGFAVLAELKPVLEQCAWEADAIEATVKQFAQDKEIGMGKVAQPIRYAVTGSTVSPSIGDTLVILGQDATLARIDRCLATQ